MSKYADGVFIQDVNGNLWNTEDWDKSVKPNAVAIISKRCKFLIALANLGYLCQMSDYRDIPFETIVDTFNDKRLAKTDYNGFKNTEIITNEFGKKYNFATGQCSKYTFPDGKTTGYIPSFGQLWMDYRNKDAVDAAFKACGGRKITKYAPYWSSTFSKNERGERGFFMLHWFDGYTYVGNPVIRNRVRPFADFVGEHFLIKKLSKDER